MRVPAVNLVRRMTGDFLSYVSRDASIGKAADECMAEGVKRECAEAPAFPRGFVRYGIFDPCLVHQGSKCVGKSLMPARRTIVKCGKKWFARYTGRRQIQKV